MNISAKKALRDVVQCPRVLDEEMAKRLKDSFIVMLMGRSGKEAIVRVADRTERVWRIQETSENQVKMLVSTGFYSDQPYLVTIKEYSKVGI